jgi:hypothetical protein
VDEKYDASELVRVVPVERVTLVSRRGFDDVVAAIYSGLGRPDDFAALVQRWATADGAEAFDAAVAEAAGSAGLIEFLSVGSEFRLHLVYGATWGFCLRLTMMAATFVSRSASIPQRHSARLPARIGRNRIPPSRREVYRRLATGHGVPLSGNKFGLGQTINTRQRGLLNPQVPTDHLIGHTGFTQPQRQRVRQRQTPQRPLTHVILLGHLTSLRPPPQQQVSNRPLTSTPTNTASPDTGRYKPHVPAAAMQVSTTETVPAPT